MKTTKRALFSSVIALILCFSMLVGTTFAWFTDSVESGVNKIIAGNLDVELYHTNKYITAKEKVDGLTDLFTVEEGKTFLWEPGAVVWENFEVANEGTLALKYQLSVNFSNATTNTKGETLAKVLKVAFVKDGISGYSNDAAGRTALINKLTEENAWQPLESFMQAGQLNVTDHTNDAYGIVIYWAPSDIDNDFNNQGKQMSIDLGIKLVATQVEGEFDSFGDDYDEDAWADGFEVVTAEDLQAAINNGETNIVLTDDIVVEEPIIIPAAPTNYAMRSNAVVLNLNGKTISSALAEAALVNNGVLVIANGTIESTAANGGNAINNKGTLTLAKGTNVIGAPFDKESGNPAYTILSSGNLTIEDGVHVSAERGCLYLQGQGETVINGGTFTNADLTGKLDRSVSAHVVYIASGASNKLTINGGTFAHNFPGTSGGVVVLNISATTVTVNGGNFSGGNYYGKWDNLSDWGYGSTRTPFVVTGGTFTGMDNNYVASGHTVVKHSDGTYTVVPEVENVTLSATEFAGIYAGDTAKTYYVFDKTGLMNLNELFKTVYSGEGVPTIINLEADVDLSGEDWKPLDAMWITFNGNGHTISNLTASGMDAAGRRSGFWAYAGGVVINDLTLENVTVNGSQAGIFAGSAEGTRINNCFLKGNNVVNFVAGVEEWNGIGAICGIASTAKIDVTIVDGATVTLNRGDMVTAFGCTYIDDLTGHIGTNSGTITNNGTITATGRLTFAVTTAAELDAALNDGKNVVLAGNLKFSSSDTTANSGYGATGVSVKGGVLDGNGHSLGINNWGTWDAAVHTTGGTIKNLTINSGMRGIFMGSATADVYIDNVTIDGTIYTFNSDGGSKEYGVYISNSTLNGWTSHSDVHKEVVYTNCEFGEGQGYAFCRPYGPTTFTECEFEQGYYLDMTAGGTATLIDCTVNGVELTAENYADYITIKLPEGKSLVDCGTFG